MAKEVAVRKLDDMEDIDEKIIENKPWAKQLMSTMLQRTKKAVLNWAHIVITIGERDLDLDDYVKIFVHQVDNIYEELINDVDLIQDKRYESIEEFLQQLQNLCCDLNVEMPEFTYKDTPLCDIYHNVREKVEKYQAMAEIRLKELNELNEKQLKLCKSLGKPPTLLPTTPLPLPHEIEALRSHIEALENDALEREEKFFQMKEEICEIVEQLGVAPTLNFEEDILNMTNTQVRITDEELEQLKEYHGRLVKQCKNVKEEISELRQKIDSLWDKLETDIAERDVFRGKTPGNSLKTLEILKEEVKKLEEKKKANIQVFIQKQRDEIRQLWDKCHCAENERKEFTFMFSECYNEDLFDLHELEIQKWKSFYNTNEELFTLLEEYTKLWNDHLELEQKSGGANRYKNRGGQLLIEEKQRNKLRRRIPKCEETLQKLSDSYFFRKGEHFRTFGLTIPEYISKLHTDADNDFKIRLSAKKQQREQLTTVGASCKATLFPPSPARATLSCRTNLCAPSPAPPGSCSKRKLLFTPGSVPSKKSKQVSVRKVPKTGLPKLNVSKTKRRSGRAKQRLSFTKKADKENRRESTSTSYDDFETDVGSKKNARSTEFGLRQ